MCWSKLYNLGVLGRQTEITEWFSTVQQGQTEAKLQKQLRPYKESGNIDSKSKLTTERLSTRVGIFVRRGI